MFVGGKDCMGSAEECKISGVWKLFVINLFVFNTLTKKVTLSIYSLGSKRIKFDV